MRAEERRGEKPRYDRRWRRKTARPCHPCRQGIQPVVRFRKPDWRCRRGRSGKRPHRNQQMTNWTT